MATPDTTAFGGLIHAASGTLLTLGDRVLAPLSVTSTQWKVLTLLARSGPTRMAQLTEALLIDQGAVSRLVSRLERRGLIARKPDPDDARAFVVALSARGQTVHAQCEQLVSGVMRRLVDRLPSADQRALARALAAFTHAAREELAAAPNERNTRRSPKRVTRTSAAPRRLRRQRR